VGPFGPDSSGQEYYVGDCSKCGNGLSTYGSPGYESCGNSRSESYTYYSLGCGMTPSTIIGYRTACGLADGQIIGAHIVYEKGYQTGYNGNLNNVNNVANASPLMAPSYMVLDLYEEEEVIEEAEEEPETEEEIEEEPEEVEEPEEETETETEEETTEEN